MAKSEYLTEYDGIVKTMQMYIDGSKQGKSEVMRPAFHPDASFFGYAGGYAGEQLATGTKFLFDWIDKNGPAPKIEPRVVSVDILDSIAVVRLEVAGWSGNLAGSDVRMSDLFTLLKMPGGMENHPEGVSLARLSQRV
jgi:Putative lumazine-binding